MSVSTINDSNSIVLKSTSLLLALLIFFGYMITNLYFLLIMIFILAFIISMKKNLNLLINNQNILWLICLLCVLVTLIYSADRVSTFKFLIMFFCLIFTKMIYEQTSNWQRIILSLFFIFSLVHVIATLAQFAFPSTIDRLNSILMSGENLAVNRILLSNNAYAGITGQTGANSLYITIFISICISKFIMYPKHKIIYLCLLFCGLFAILLTAKRGPILFNLIDIFIVTVIVMKLNHKKMKSVVIFFIVFFLAVIIFYYTPAAQRIVEKYMHLASENDVLNGRNELWRQSFDIFLDNPVFGVGANTIVLFIGDSSHNTYIQILAEFGIIGSLFFYAAFIATMITSYMNVRTLFYGQELNNEEKTGIIISLYIQIYFLLYGLSGNALYNIVVFTAYMIMLSVINSYIYQKNKLNGMMKI